MSAGAGVRSNADGPDECFTGSEATSRWEASGGAY